jgi:DNA (cytosine-5)-methyltransferase 1
MSERPIGIDLFAGAGGMSLGFEQAGFDVVACVELDPIHCATHEFNFPQTKVICASVADVSGDDIRRRAALGKRKIDVVFGGAPCQGFSMIGKRALDDPRNRLVYHFVRIVKELDASYFVFENVKGLTVGEHKRFLQEIVEEFAASGYNVVLPWKVLNAAEFGVPQDRRRLFLMGAKRGLKLPKYPEVKCRKPGSPQGDLDLPVGPCVWDALADLPEAEAYPQLIDGDTVKARYGQPSRYALMLRGFSNSDADYSHPRIYDRELLTSSARADHTPLSRKRFAATEHGDTEPVSRFHKLNPEGVCNTLRAGTASDRGAFTSPRPIHPFSHRCITVREGARLHSYPDWFRLHASKWHGFRQIGNSVPPLLARAVASAVVAALGVEPARPRKAIPLGDVALLNFDMREASARYDVPSNTIAKRQRLAANG